MTIDTPMRCPICTVELINGEDRRYETLNDHICNPNGIHPKRETFVCRNTKCEAFKGQLFWDFDGGGPYNSSFKDHYNYIDDNPCSIPSFDRKLHAEIRDKSQDTTVIRTKWLLVRRVANRKADEFGNTLEETYHHDFYFNDGMGYCLWIPGYRMLVHCIKAFYSSCRLYTNTEAGKKALGNKVLDNFRKFPKDEWWRKATRLWIRLFHGKLLKESIAITGRGLGK